MVNYSDKYIHTAKLNTEKLSIRKILTKKTIENRGITEGEKSAERNEGKLHTQNRVRMPDSFSWCSNGTKVHVEMF